MKRTPIFLAAALLCIGANQGRAGEVFSYFKRANSTAAETQPAPQQANAALVEQETLPAPKQTAPAPVEMHAAPVPVAPFVERAPDAACAAHCGGCNTHDHFSCAKLKAWLCFRPTRELCPCSCNKARPCCTPELYTFFLCRYGPNVPCCPTSGCNAGAAGCGTRGTHATSSSTWREACTESSSCAPSACGCTWGQRFMNLFQRSDSCHAEVCGSPCVTSEDQAKPAK